MEIFPKKYINDKKLYIKMRVKLKYFVYKVPYFFFNENKAGSKEILMKTK